MVRQHDPNRTAYSRSKVVSWYTAFDGLMPAEAAILARLAGDPRLHGRVLDLGVGGGRTTGHLLATAQEYVGIDYVAELVEATRSRFPGARIEQGDARDLSTFADDTFDFCLFSFNGIDYVGHDDRLRVLAEVRRVLRPGGLFVFSTHNRDHRRLGLLPWQGTPAMTRGTVRSSLSALLHTRTRRRVRRGEVATPDYALVNDDAHGWSLLTYYIGAGAQVRQLEQCGFVDVVAHNGAGDPGKRDVDTTWLYYLAVAT